MLADRSSCPNALPPGISSNYRFQVATYTKLYGNASRTVRLDTVTKTKTIQLVEQSFAIVESHLVQIERICPLAGKRRLGRGRTGEVFGKNRHVGGKALAVG